jgi:hypothetical protein
MILFGVIWLIIASRLPGREVTYIYSGEAQPKQIDKKEASAARNRQRKLRKKLK